ncbi:class D sortase [Risungbinella massiliensis]|uniref:class D sortase n=1 Tax=Risungbinella massiliensis TaxID=1329796 RepID=UPI0005CBB47D|nr:class D sortase [Risungbinella massiliensis]
MRKILGLLIIIAGCALLFPNAWQWWQQSQLIRNDPKEAQAIATDWQDRTYQQPLAVGEKTNQKTPIGQEMGELVLPQLGAILPIVEGADEDSLEKGVGHYIGYGTVNPGETGHVVLSGHRDTVFREVGKLKIGDRLYVRSYQKVYVYQIRKTWITHAEDLTVIVPYSKPILTLTTCYPFDFVGSAPDRYVIQAELIEIKPDTKI